MMAPNENALQRVTKTYLPISYTPFLSGDVRIGAFAFQQWFTRMFRFMVVLVVVV